MPDVSPPPVARRRWYQFSLRTLLLVMVVGSVIAGLAAYRVRQVQLKLERMAASAQISPAEPPTIIHGDTSSIFARAMEQALDQMIKEFELSDATQVELLLFALFRSEKIGPDVKSSILSIVVYLPAEGHCAEVRRYEHHYADTNFLLRFTKVRSAAVTSPVSVITSTESNSHGKTSARERVAVYDSTKGWVEPPSTPN